MMSRLARGLIGAASLWPLFLTLTVVHLQRESTALAATSLLVALYLPFAFGSLMVYAAQNLQTSKARVEHAADLKDLPAGAALLLTLAPPLTLLAVAPAPLIQLTVLAASLIPSVPPTGSIALGLAARLMGYQYHTIRLEAVRPNESPIRRTLICKTTTPPRPNEDITVVSIGATTLMRVAPQEH